MNQYCISLFIATYSFWATLFPNTIEDLHVLELMPKGRRDLWWALTLPCGDFTNRLIGYLACKIIRATYGSCEVDFVTLFHAGRTLLKLEDTMVNQKHCVVLAPTHRSLMDFILAKYVAFSMVGLGIDVPTVYAENEFDDPKLSEKIGATKAEFDRHATLAAFLEGRPSPDGRIQKPSTKFLKALVDSPGDHDYTLIPLCIDYDRVDIDNDVMKEALNCHSDLGLWDLIKLYWQIRASGKLHQSFGNVRISFGVPTSAEKGSNLEEVAAHVQKEHLRLTTVSDDQLSVAERHLKIPAETLRAAVEQLGVHVCANKTKDPIVDMEKDSATDLWRLHLQWMYRFAPFMRKSHPKWAKWLSTTGDIIAQQQEDTPEKTNEIDDVLTILCSKLEDIDALARRALLEKDHGSGGVTHDSLVKEMARLDKETPGTLICPSLLEAAASFTLKSS